MNHSVEGQKQGYLVLLSAIVVGVAYQFLPFIFPQTSYLEVIGAFFNLTFMFILLYIILKEEFLDWFKHFSIKWILIGIPFLFIVGTLAGSLWSAVAGGMTSNDINSVLSWEYVMRNVPFMLLGEELLSIGILYAAWKKLNWKFWQATMLCSILFALWHLPAYDYNALQCLVTIIPSRLVLNYLFKKTNSIWVTWIVHIAFDVITFLPILLK
ncbi:CPBP family intramembrane metalloprotease [Listeria sp. SHR_NRA_18]|uniref:CPBP family intramembrane glutamic endopeptidase n=1 Tax=Listeria sp. SHR_NRA_18 TaxID=2269046 RepID=UPI00051D3CF0|nr:CPBP family intramembrane glutamic endopeptidase [Listeria sp. SHR_NRA_18]KGL46187.1 CAAX protease [Listeriaceae bacterium FSL A5-0209]RQW65718.1 CPBP family intramembrane metalloprotease [Listeria sp. SHR_NRA_18]